MTTQAQFFDLHTRGIGYLNRVREVTVKKGNPFMACTIAALRGDTNSPEYTYFDTRVSGEEAEKLIRRCQPAAEDGKKVLVGFTIGDIYTDTFVYQRGDKKGETGVTLKGRLLRISFIKVDGETVWQQAPSEHSEPTEHNESALPENDTDAA